MAPNPEFVRIIVSPVSSAADRSARRAIRRKPKFRRSSPNFTMTEPPAWESVFTGSVRAHLLCIAWCLENQFANQEFNQEPRFDQIAAP
jgi:hypothetical protein